MGRTQTGRFKSITLLCAHLRLQNSFYKLMMGDNKSEKFFKVLHDRMKEAQMDIKATVTVNVGEMTHKANEKELETSKL